MWEEHFNFRVCLYTRRYMYTFTQSRGRHRCTEDRLTGIAPGPRGEFGILRSFSHKKKWGVIFTVTYAPGISYERWVCWTRKLYVYTLIPGVFDFLYYIYVAVADFQVNVFYGCVNINEWKFTPRTAAGNNFAFDIQREL